MSCEPRVEPAGRPGPGRFQWNTGGWFGGLVGGTAWIFVLGFQLLGLERGAGIGVLGCGLVAVLAGLALWFGRFRIEPFVAMELLIGLCGAAGCAALGLYGRSGLAAPSFPEGPDYWFLALYPGLMLVFWFWERAALRAARESQASGT